jgi:serine/threonine protein kinase
MPEPATTRTRLLDYVRKSGLIDPGRLDGYLRSLAESGPLPDDPPRVAACFVRDGLLTTFQAQQLLRGRYRNFMLGKYKVLEPLGTGGMSKVYLCEHVVMRRRVALKLLPADRIDDPSSVGRFHREARAVAALDHPNIVRAHDIDSQGDKLLFLIMDYVDGVNLHDLVKKRGPLGPDRAANYVRQAALGLQHIADAGLIHRDLKPGNLLLDRAGSVKILDLGLARFQGDHNDDLTGRYDHKAILGTADYIAPEQALRSSNVDSRADIYSLGATLYYLLSGRAPFESQSAAQKLLSHQLRDPEPLTAFRSDLPAGLRAVVSRMMAKAPKDRYQSPRQVADALAAWSGEAALPPDPEDLPRLSPAAQSPSGASSSTGPGTPNGHLSETMRRPRSAPLQRPAPAPASPPAVAPRAKGRRLFRWPMALAAGGLMAVLGGAAAAWWMGMF